VILAALGIRGLRQAGSGEAIARDHSLAVLPFVNTNGDSADEHFSDGLTDELIGALGKVASLKVVGHTSVFALKGKGLGVRAAADTLGVATVLEGSVRRSGERLKVNAQLVSARDNTVLWSDAYDRAMTDVFAVQEEIARAIVSALRVKLATPRAPLVRRTTTDLSAYDLYLKGRYFMARVTPPDLQRSAGYFAQAISRDSSFAQAYAGLADASVLLAVFSNSATPPELARARIAAARALTLDSTLAEAHTSLASVLFAFDWKWQAAEREFERAAALDPGYALTHQRWGLFLMYEGRFGEAKTILEQALEHDRLYASANMNLGRLYVLSGDPRRGIPLLQTAIELSPGLALAHEQLGHAFLESGNSTEALDAFRKAAALSGAQDSAQLAYALGVTGHRSEAEHVLRDLLASSERRHLPPLAIAVAYVGLGDADTAFHWLEQAYRERSPQLHTIKTAPGFERLHNDARWKDLLRRIGL
jgi:TolB-like protein/tetratricopeptide (TPR) repeat protein